MFRLENLQPSGKERKRVGRGGSRGGSGRDRAVTGGTAAAEHECYLAPDFVPGGGGRSSVDYLL